MLHERISYRIRGQRDVSGVPPLLLRRAACQAFPALSHAQAAGAGGIPQRLLSQFLANLCGNKQRLLTQETFLTSIGRAGKAKAGTGSFATVDGLPPFLAAENLKDFISDELRQSTTPIFFRNDKGTRAAGYEAKLLPMVCEVYLKFRDKKLRNQEQIPINQKHIVEACDLLMRGLAHVGIVALVDEATGYCRAVLNQETGRVYCT